MVLLWQVPSPRTLAWVRQRLPGAPILLCRFRTEAAVRQFELPYCSPACFLPLADLIRLDQVGMDARTNWAGPPEPTFHGMPLVDGDLTRTGVWSQMVATAAALLMIRRALPRVQVFSDWMGGRLAAAVGLRVSRLWQADLADPNWPVRRWLREHRPRPGRGDGRAAERHAKHLLRSADPQARTDVLFFIGHWVEPRLLASFPIEPLVAAGYRCAMWVHKRSAALAELSERTGIPCLHLGIPEPVRNAGLVPRQVRDWCDRAAAGGLFAPLRGNLARHAVELMLWPAWSRKLLAMHRLLSSLLAVQRPRLLIAAAEKDWSPYCAHYAARQLGIPSVGMKHGIWVPGSDLQQLDHRYHRPLTAPRILAYTPGDAGVWAGVPGIEAGRVTWQGNPRLDTAADVGPEMPARILIAGRGMGEGHAMSLRHAVLRWNIPLIEALHDRLGDRVRVRLHPWDVVENYPARLRPIVLPSGEDLGDQLRRYAAVVTTYSNVVLDAAAAGRPVFQWDHERLGLDRSEIAAEGAAVVSHNLEGLTGAVARFLEDPLYRHALLDRAARFPNYLRRRTPGGDLTTAITRWLSEQIACPSARKRDPAPSPVPEAALAPGAF
jgi:hypothetical protein